jgi:hypothetical protein
MIIEAKVCTHLERSVSALGRTMTVADLLAKLDEDTVNEAFTTLLETAIQNGLLDDDFDEPTRKNHGDGQ